MPRLVQAILSEARRVLTERYRVRVTGASRPLSSGGISSSSGSRVVLVRAESLVILTLDEGLARAIGAAPDDAERSGRAQEMLGFCRRIADSVGPATREGGWTPVPPLLVNASAGVVLPPGARIDGLSLQTDAGALHAAVIDWAPAAASEPLPDTPRALIIDDDPLVRKLFGKVLSDAGIEVRTAGDCQQGTDMLAELKPDVVLLDIEMPCVNGLECLPAIRRLSPQSRVIMLTARGNVDTVRECVAKGAAAFISKTCKPAYLRRRVLQLLNREPVFTG